MISLKNKPKITFNAPVVLGFAMICLLATIANMITAGGSNRLLFSTYRSSMFSPLTYLRLFTHVFGHSGWAHLVGNMAYILLLGPMLEEKYGSVRLVAVMAVTALVTVIYLGQQIVDGITVRDNISNLSHILGGIVGGAAGYVLNRKH